MHLCAVDLKAIKPEVFRVFGTQNALLTAGDKTNCNTMTIGWCQLGKLWNLDACTVYVRPERYTYRFMEEHNYFTVSVLPERCKSIMQVCGTKSGRDMDKIRECGLTLCHGAGDAPFFEEAEWVLVCKKLYAQDMKPEFVKDERVFQSYTPAKGSWHRMYVGEVLEAHQK